MELFLDGTSIGTKTGFDNYDKFDLGRYVRLGVPYFQVGAPTGILYLDKLEFNDQDTLIGS
jgi:hypothetical protein